MSQALPLREQLRALIAIQELDLKIDQLKKKKADVPLALKKLQGSLQDVQASVSLKTNSITEIEKAQRQTQAALELNGDRIARADAKLSAASNSQEFQAGTKEKNQLETLKKTLGDQIKQADESIARVKSEIEALGSKVSAAQAEFDKAAGEQQGIADQLETEIKTLMASRGEYSPRVERTLLARYDFVRSKRAGVGLAPAGGGRCGACNMMIPPQKFIVIQRGLESQDCTSCHRILFIPEANAAG